MCFFPYQLLLTFWLDSCFFTLSFVFLKKQTNNKSHVRKSQGAAASESHRRLVCQQKALHIESDFAHLSPQFSWQHFDGQVDAKSFIWKAEVFSICRNNILSTIVFFTSNIHNIYTL